MLFQAVETTLTSTTLPLPQQYTTHTCLQKQSPPHSFRHKHSIPLLGGSAPSFPGCCFGKNTCHNQISLLDLRRLVNLDLALLHWSLGFGVCEKSWLTNSLTIFLFSSAWLLSCCSAALLRPIPSLHFYCHCSSLARSSPDLPPDFSTS